MNIQDLINQKNINHWAEELVCGDRCKATIRHETDGSLNKINVDVIVIENIISQRKIKAYFEEEVFINYNNLHNDSHNSH